MIQALGQPWAGGPSMIAAGRRQRSNRLEPRSRLTVLCRSAFGPYESLARGSSAGYSCLRAVATLTQSQESGSLGATIVPIIGIRMFFLASMSASTAP